MTCCTNLVTYSTTMYMYHIEYYVLPTYTQKYDKSDNLTNYYITYVILEVLNIAT